IGDAVLLIPMLRALRAKFPDARIVFLGTALTVPVIAPFTDLVDACIDVEIKRLLDPRFVIRLVRTLRGLRCDAAIDAEQWSRTSASLLALSRAPVRVGFRTPGQHR